MKDISLEIPNAPQVFLEREAPTVDIQLHHNSAQVDEGVYQTVLTVTVTAKVKDKTMFLVEVGQAGVFVDPQHPRRASSTPCSASPARTSSSRTRARWWPTSTVRAGFPPVVLNPVNFESIYQQAVQQQQNATPQIITPTVQ